MTWARIKDAITFEVDSDNKSQKVNLDTWQKLVLQLGVLKDKYGNPATAFYGVGYGTRTTDQFVMLAGKIFWLTKDGAKVTSLRYDEKYGYIYGLALNHKLFGNKLVGVKVNDFLGNPAILRDIGKWQVIADHAEPAMFSLSRVRYVDGAISFVVNHVETVRRVVTLTRVNDTVSAGWSETYRTPYTIIGSIATLDDVYVGHRLIETGFELYFQKLDHPAQPLFIS
ncbi:MAG: hypothetical protein ACOYUZ_04195 [Patescibacteria group bacterium]